MYSTQTKQCRLRQKPTSNNLVLRICWAKICQSGALNTTNCLAQNLTQVLIS